MTTVEVNFKDNVWTVTLNGVFITSFWRRGRAYEVAYRLRQALGVGH